MSSQDGPARVGEKVFTERDQELFALLSGDRNPVHMDPLAARRTLTGRLVVHGVHVLLTALELSPDQDWAAPVALDCTFGNPVSVGDDVVFVRGRERDRVVLRALVRELACTEITLRAAGEVRTGEEAAVEDEATDVTGLSAPLDEQSDVHVGKRYAVRLNEADAAAAFPRTCERLGSERVAGIAALSYFVGMVCPGLHSLFLSLSVETGGAAPDGGSVVFLVKRYDERVGLFDVSFDGCIRGGLKAFLWPAAEQQPSLEELSDEVDDGEFRGSRSLVVGGSRGLGELTAKILAAGGGDVVITYASGADDARRICDEVGRAGRGTCRALRYDVLADALEPAEIPGGVPTAVYFFATPRIFRKKAATFEPDVFGEFYEFYVKRFYELCAALEAAAGSGKVEVFFPSSVAVEERPQGITEYAMAKAAAETLIDDINRSFANVSVTSARLPRLSTDQTVSILKVPAESNIATLLPIIRSVSGAR